MRACHLRVEPIGISERMERTLRRGRDAVKNANFAFDSPRETGITYRRLSGRYQRPGPDRFGNLQWCCLAIGSSLQRWHAARFKATIGAHDAEAITNIK